MEEVGGALITAPEVMAVTTFALPRFNVLNHLKILFSLVIVCALVHTTMIKHLLYNDQSRGMRGDSFPRSIPLSRIIT